MEIRVEEDANARHRQKPTRCRSIIHWSVTELQQELSRFASCYFIFHAMNTTQPRNKFVFRDNGTCLCVFLVVVAMTERVCVCVRVLSGSGGD